MSVHSLGVRVTDILGSTITIERAEDGGLKLLFGDRCIELDVEDAEAIVDYLREWLDE